MEQFLIVLAIAACSGFIFWLYAGSRKSEIKKYWSKDEETKVWNDKTQEKDWVRKMKERENVGEVKNGYIGGIDGCVDDCEHINKAGEDRVESQSEAINKKRRSA